MPKNANANASASTLEREVVITRVVDAPARLLFAAYTKAEHVKQWFGPPGYPLTLCEVDFREGGRFRFAMMGPDGVQGSPFGGRYLEIVKNKRVVYENGFEEVPPGMPADVAGRMVVTVTFDENENGQTTLTIHTLFDSLAMRNAHMGFGYEQGVGSTIPALVAVARAIGEKEST
jgi:uncharacterized protein YndB with AHSA1/START domain